MTETDRRKSERIMLDEPLKGKVGGVSVSVLDIGLHGSKLEHQPPLPVGGTVAFSVTWDGHALEFSAKVVRSVLQGFRDGRKILHSGLEFLGANGDSELLLRQLVTGESPADESLVGESPSAAATPEAAWQPTPFFSYDDDELLQLVAAEEEAEEARSKSGMPFIECRLDEKGIWTRTPVIEPFFPVDGFTIPRPDNDKELDLLCQAYKAADKEKRLKIRASLESRTRGGS